jgi:hypothetical protein
MKAMQDNNRFPGTVYSHKKLYSVDLNISHTQLSSSN